jgi:hypothetical protein
MRAHRAPAATGRHMLHHILLILTDRLPVQIVQHLHAQTNILNQLITPTLGKILAHHDAQHLELAGVRRHGVGGHDPAPRADLVRHGELVVVFVFRRVQSECDEGKSLATSFTHDQEAHVFETATQVIRRAGKVRHDASVPALAEADELVVLPDDLRRAFGEV